MTILSLRDAVPWAFRTFIKNQVIHNHLPKRTSSNSWSITMFALQTAIKTLLTIPAFLEGNLRQAAWGGNPKEKKKKKSRLRCSTNGTRILIGSVLLLIPVVVNIKPRDDVALEFMNDAQTNGNLNCAIMKQRFARSVINFLMAFFCYLGNFQLLIVTFCYMCFIVVRRLSKQKKP